VTHPDILRQVAAYYEGKLVDHGATPPGVDWNSLASQQRRFRELLRGLDLEPGASLLDYGCGYGALADYLHEHRVDARYRGFDIATPMVEAARARHRECGCEFTDAAAALLRSDFTVASGIFNVKLQTPVDEWREYMLATILDLCRLTRRAVAFNVLTMYSDPARRRPDLFYADPLWLFDHCKTQITPAVTLLHDYPLFEFTLVLRLSDG
jgi:SAM-dependent methyltransferase